MKKNNQQVKLVQQFYDENTQLEWERLDRRPIEFSIAKSYLSRYINSGDKVLDLGGGPGRYACWLASLGAHVTLADLSKNSITFAKKKAKELGHKINCYQLDARDLTPLKGKTFNHIILFGPLYHLLDVKDRQTVMENCLKLLKPGGKIYCTFISSYTSIMYYLKNEPERILDESDFMKERLNAFIQDAPFSGQTFTQVHYTKKNEALDFMAQFPLEKNHFLGLEGMLAPFESMTSTADEAVVNAWIDVATKVCEHEDLISWAEHFMYIGTKKLT